MALHEQAMQSAIVDYDSRIFTNLRAAARAYDLPESTLRARRGGATNTNAGHAHQQRLTPDQEEFLVEWIIEQDKNGYPPSHARAREMATRILRYKGDDKPLGKRWISLFLRRNPRVASIIGRKLDIARAGAAIPEKINAFLETFKRVRTRLGIRAENI